MKKIICEDYAAMSAKAAEIITSQVKNNPESILGLATGSTPIGTYEILQKMYQTKEIDFSKVKTFNLDEYYPIKRDNNQSYYYFMHENLFNKINVLSENINIPNGEVLDPEKECREYDAKIETCGGIDLQILGIGGNGHIGFNEPDLSLPLTTHLVNLSEDTINANARFFSNVEDVPKQAITLGMGGIFSAKSILLLISGQNKAKIAKELFSDTISTQLPASLLKLHPNVTVILDQDAASLI